MQNHYFDNTHPLRPYTYSNAATPGTRAPGNALRGDNPRIVKGSWPCEKDGAWLDVEDYRKRDASDIIPEEAAQKATEYWLPGDTWRTEARTMDDLGPLPEDAILTRPEKSEEEKQKELQEQFTAATQSHLDTFARTRNYDNIMSAATYATSTVPKFAAEGQYAVEARDATWAKGYEILNDVLAGKRPMPTIEEVFAELPPLGWPV